jgi:rubrerythrin
VAKIFNFSEIIKFAIEKEIQSFQLYKKLAEQAKNKTIKEMLTDLMQQEHKHEEYFEKMLLDFKNTNEISAYDEEYKLYVQEMIAAGRKKGLIKNLDYNNLDSIVKFAVGREQDSILFYSALRNLLKQPEQTHNIDNIIFQEGQHIKKIFEIKKIIQTTS